jgi:DNA-binding NarL/FixJ family response regulator
VSSANNGTAAISSILTLCPDVVLVSMTLPPYGGLDVISSIVHTRSDLAVVALMNCEASDDERALRAGATSCLHLDSPWDQCLKVLRSAAEGDALLVTHSQVRLTQTHNRTSPLFSPAALSRREAQVLNLVARGRSVKEIASDMVISPKTVKHHLAATYAKLGVHNRTDAVMTALRQGLLQI